MHVTKKYKHSYFLIDLIDCSEGRDMCAFAHVNVKLFVSSSIRLLLVLLASMITRFAVLRN